MVPLLLAPAAYAATVEEAFDRLDQSDVKVATAQLQQALSPPPSAPRPWSVMAGFADTSGASWGQLLSGAFAVSSADDIEAGLDFAPFALAGMDGPLAETTVHLASLEDGTRVGLSVPLEPRKRAYLQDLGLVRKPTSEELAKLAGANAAYRQPWIVACRAFLGESFVPTAADKPKWDVARAGCDGTLDSRTLGYEPTLEAHVGAMEAFIGAVRDGVGKTDSNAAAMAARLDAAASPVIKALHEGAGAPWLEGVTSQDVEKAYQIHTWRSLRVRVTPTVRGSLAPIQWGYNPEPSTPLPSGELTELAGGVEVGFAHRRTAAGVSVEVATAGLDNEAGRVVSPAFTLAYLAGSLTGQPVGSEAGPALAKKQDMAKTGPELAPHWSVGIDASLDYRLNREPTQLSAIEALACTAFVDLHPSSSLAFRLGIPLQGETVTREADDTVDPPVTEESGLQLSVPVFLVTSLSL